MGAKGPRGVYVALLRGINVGAKNRIPMNGVEAIFTSVGCTSVEIYIQSGNVVFRASERLARQLPAFVSAGISKRFGFRVPVVTRTAAELERTARINPFLRMDADPEMLHVAFLAELPTATRVADLDARRSPPDEFVALGREVYLRLPNGMARTKLSNAYFDAKLATTSTVRNWRTVLKLVEMTKAQSVQR